MHRDREPLVWLCALRALFGDLSAASVPLFHASPVGQDAREARLRVRAWAIVAAVSKQGVSGAAGPDGAISGSPRSLLAVLGNRLITALGSTSPSIVCAACRAAGRQTMTLSQPYYTGWT